MILDATFEGIAESVADFTKININDIFSKSRIQNIADARHLLCWIAYSHGYTLSYIARKLNRNHATILHSIGRINDEFANKEFKLKIKEKFGDLMAKDITHIERPERGSQHNFIMSYIKQSKAKKPIEVEKIVFKEKRKENHSGIKHVLEALL